MSKTFPNPIPYGSGVASDVVAEAALRTHALELAVQLHAARARNGLTVLGDEGLTQDVVATAKRFASYLHGEEPTS